VLVGCGTIEGGWDVDAGRKYLIQNEPGKALVAFRKVAQLEPGYVQQFTSFPENIWTYIGRSYYQLGELGKARSALQRSVEAHPRAILGHIYLGLVEMRQGESQRGLRTALTGLRLLQAWFKHIASSMYGSYWDPKNAVRNEAASLIREIETNVRWQQVAPRLAALGPKMDAEIQLASQDIQQATTEYDADSAAFP